MVTNGDILAQHAKRLGIRNERTRKSLAEVQGALMQASISQADVSMARLFLNHGWITEEARVWLLKEYPQD